MMQIVEQTAVIKAPLALVQGMVYALEAIPAWATVEGTLENGRGAGVGLTYDWRFHVDRFNFKGVIEVLEQTDTRFITKTTGDINSRWTITLTPVNPNSTAIEVIVEYAPPHALLEPLADLVVQRLAAPQIAAENMARFKAMVEEKAAVAAGL